jgi:hypothetical protein
MSILQDAKKIGEYYKNVMKPILALNATLVDIQENNLLCYVEDELKKALSPQAFEGCKHRIPPINVQKRVVDKSSQIYAKPPQRKLGDTATEGDKEMWGSIVEAFRLDVSGQSLNEYFNMHRCGAWEPYLDNFFEPRLREMPKDRFFVMCEDPTDRLRVTHFVKVMGTVIEDSPNGKGVIEKTILYVYTDDEFRIIFDDGSSAQELMVAKGLDGRNEFGVIPFIYVNRSKLEGNPSADEDMFRMVTLIPILFADVNYALMFQAFSVLWGVDVDLAQIQINPNSFINLKSDPNNPGSKPSLNVLKAELDSDKAIGAIMTELALWLQSRNIRPGAVGTASQDNWQNGIAKMIDEMDTTADRKKQIPYFVDAEEALFKLVAFKLHPVWSKNPSYAEKRQFSQGLKYQVKFSEQISWQTRLELTQEAKAEVDLGCLSRESAMMRLNPEMTPEELAAEWEKIKAEQAIFGAQNQAAIPNQELKAASGTGGA